VRSLSIAIAIGVAASLASCGFSTRKHEAALLVHAAKRLEAVKTGKGTLAVSVKTPKATEGLAGLPIPAGLSVPAVALQLAFADRAATSGSAQTAGGALPEAVFQGPVVFMKRPQSAADSESQFGFRAWSRLDFSTLKRKDKNSLGTVNLANPINPTYLVRLLAGTLSGSVRKVGPDVLNGVTTTHYRMNVDPSKAFSRMRDKERQAVAKAFSSNNIKGSVFKDAEVWIDRDGLPRRLIVNLRQKFTIRVSRDIATDVVFPISYTIELSDFGAPLQIAAPSADTVARVGTLNALLESAQA
jgi:hypothetical protein